MEDPKMWRVNRDVAQAVYVRLQGDVLSAHLRLKALLEVSDSQTTALAEPDFVDKIIEELGALGMAQQRLYALKSVQPHQTLPRGHSTPHDRSISESAAIGRRNAVIGDAHPPLSPEEVERKLVADFRRKTETEAKKGKKKE
jgi:hypothetical protein